MITSSHAWTIENGIIRFANPQTAELEVVARLDYDATLVPNFEDPLFGGDLELVRLFSKVVQAFVTMSMCERLKNQATTPQQIQFYDMKLVGLTKKYQMELAEARSAQQRREVGVFRLGPIMGRGRRIRDYR